MQWWGRGDEEPGQTEQENEKSTTTRNTTEEGDGRLQITVKQGKGHGGGELGKGRVRGTTNGKRGGED